MSLAIGLGIVMLGVAATSGAEDGEDISVTQNPAIDSLIPDREAEILRGDLIGIDLAEGFAAALSLETSDGRTVQIPTDEMEGNFQDNLARFVFRAGPGRVIDALPPQSNCLTATYWPVSNPSDTDTIRWCFEVT